MVSLRKRRYLVIYPEYFDKLRSRGQGRRLPLNLADEKPTLKKLVKACEVLKYEFEIEPKKAYPGNWEMKQGRILIRIKKQKVRPKEEYIKEIAKILRKLVPKKKKGVKGTPKKSTEKTSSKGPHKPSSKATSKKTPKKVKK